MSEATNELLTPTEVARRLRVSPRTVVIWLQRGKLAGLKVGKCWRVKSMVLDQFLRGQSPPADEDDDGPGDYDNAFKVPRWVRYDWGPSGPPKGRRVYYVEGKGALVEPPAPGEEVVEDDY